MTQTTTDYLYQIAAPAPDRAYSAGSAGDGQSSFDDHLSQASTIGAPTSEASRANDLQSDNSSYRDRGTQVSSEPAPAPKVKETPAPPDSATRDESAAEFTTDNKASADTAATNNDGNDKPEPKADAALTAAGQAACDHPQQATKTPPKQNVAAGISAKTSVPSDKQAAHSADPTAANRTDRQPPNSDGQSSAFAVASAEQTAQIATTSDAAAQTVTDHSSENSEADLAARHNKARTSGAVRSQPQSGIEVTDERATDETSIAKASVDISAGATQTAGNSVHTHPTSSIPLASEKADGDADGPDESRGNSRTDTRGVARNEASAISNATLVANGLSANTGDAPANDQPKGDKSEPAVKPIAAKGDTSAASQVRLNRATAGVNRSGQSASTGDAPPVDSSRFVGRVAKAFQTAQDRGGTLQLRLSPPELGSLRLELTVKDGVMSAALQTENANARRLLLDHLPALRDRLAEQNIRVDRFDVDVRREGTSGQADARGSQQQQFQQPDQPSPRQPAPTVQQKQDSSPQEVLTVAPIVSDAGLNLIV
jgi:flagellar hook-length control protein FliK